MLLHHLAGAFDAVLAQALPVDPLLPVQADYAEIRSHRVLLRLFWAVARSRAGYRYACVRKVAPAIRLLLQRSVVRQAATKKDAVTVAAILGMVCFPP